MDDYLISEELPQDEEPGFERMWPLDLSLAVLGALVIFTVASRLDANDPRWLYNPWTYAAAVPLGVVGLSLLLRNIASRYVRRSMQLGFLLSIVVHLMLLIWAVNYMILSPLWPSATTGVEPIRAPLRKTVPDYLFSRTDLPQKQPDWSRPLDADTTSREVPVEPRKLPPLETNPTELRLSREQPRLETEERPFLVPKAQPAAALPVPAASAAPLSRRDLAQQPDIQSSVDVPDVPSVQTPAPGSAVERSDTVTRVESSAARAASRDLSRLPLVQQQVQSPTFTAPPPLIERRQASELPRVGELAMNENRQSIRRADVAAAPAGSAPATPTLRSARESADASRMLNDRPIAQLAPSSEAGTSLLPASEMGAGAVAWEQTGDSDAPLARSIAAMAGMPSIASTGDAVATPEMRGRRSLAQNLPEGDLSAPDLANLSTSLGQNQVGQQDSTGASPARDRLSQMQGSDNGSGTTAGNASGAELNALGPPAMAANIDLAVKPGPAGLSADPSQRIGFALAEQMPEVTSIDFGAREIPRRELGGPATPAGNQVSGLRPFDRRKMRTSGGAAPTPAGELGPETEEAIERGLAYLAERQNPDGSWSLQGHGEEVLMRSDTAATGLCLLAFQGAGYTHKQHQYADTVARGLQFLVKSQRSTGDLFKRENSASNQNAWLYSHGIAALALCEAYGMTNDQELKRPAERAIEFIATSQDPKFGGWRYVPRSGSDTSVTGWMMMATKSAELSGLRVPRNTYQGIEKWMDSAQASDRLAWEYRYNPFAPDTPSQRHGRNPTKTMTAVGLLARLYLGWERGKPEMQRGADVLAQAPPALGTPRNNYRDTYYWYYATQVMFHMGGSHWNEWNSRLNPILVSSQVVEGPDAGSWDPLNPVPDRWAAHAGRLYVTAMNLLSLEVYYRHLPIYVETGK